MSSNWNNNGRYHGGFPAAVKKRAEQELPKVCAHCGATNCPLRLDHIRNTARGGNNTIDNAQWLCDTCHDHKTRAEAAEGQAIRTAKRTLPKRPHPLDRMMPG
ncbi:HNH endonuclease [Gordonia malaquae]|uniref:HNH nuclease domain-containing protein n=1 Tax=Gordonia malaquae NBRC 108250 TaxID=1223542 RepID=M3VGW1_GORML|nr:HNH endonuclease [Gordonia malaquae]GAC81239.1 hypothetical protein GM1_030_00680 [Gordonia malaquae NBRC 108250]SEE24691.1 HNH endonuclease [Gordonia malaquae]